MRSSYIENNYGSVFKSIVLSSKPELIVECGVLDGYSLLSMAQSVKFNHIRRGVFGHIYAIDLWDGYEYNHGDFGRVHDLLAEFGVIDYVDLVNHDAFDAPYMFDEDDIDLLHMDISNDGDVLIKILQKWESKLSPNGVILFEGGSEERDEVEWMKKYNKIPINDTLRNNPLVYEAWDFQILHPFPSLTLLWKKKGKRYASIG